jgi:predicted transcriptional regulator
MQTLNPDKNYNKLIGQLNQYRFSYSTDFEIGMRQVLGQRAYHAPDIAGMPASARKLLLEAVKKLSKRVDEIITMDERLRERLLSEFEELRKHVDKIDKVPNQMPLTGTLFNIISRLLGYDWCDGKVYRTPVYFRTKSQEFKDYRNRYISKWRDLEREEHSLVLVRRRIAANLKKEGMPISQIARVLNMSEYAVGQLIKDRILAKTAELWESGHSLDEIRKELREEGLESLLPLIREELCARQRMADPSSG